MAYTVNIMGHDVRVDTIDELAALIGMAPRLAQGLKVGVAGSAENSEQWSGLMNKSSDGQLRFMAYVRAHTGAALEDVAAALAGGKPNAIGAWVRVIELNSKKLGLKANAVVRREVNGVRPNRVIRYYAGPLLKSNEVPDPASR